MPRAHPRVRIGPLLLPLPRSGCCFPFVAFRKTRNGKTRPARLAVTAMGLAPPMAAAFALACPSATPTVQAWESAPPTRWATARPWMKAWVSVRGGLRGGLRGRAGRRFRRGRDRRCRRGWRRRGRSRTDDDLRGRRNDRARSRCRGRRGLGRLRGRNRNGRRRHWRKRITGNERRKLQDDLGRGEDEGATEQGDRQDRDDQGPGRAHGAANDLRPKVREPRALRASAGPLVEGGHEDALIEVRRGMRHVQ